MFIGIYKISLLIPDNQSLKGKRSIVKSLCQRLQNQFNIAVAEIDNNEQWQIATIGITCISNNGKIIETLLSRIKNFLEKEASEFQLMDEYKKIMVVKD